VLVILSTQEAEIRRIVVLNQSGQTFHETLSQKALHNNRAGRVSQGEGPELKTQYRKRKKKKILMNTCHRDSQSNKHVSSSIAPQE
jgi:hypothetical protein